jgi:hypothetical protein
VAAFGGTDLLARGDRIWSPQRRLEMILARMDTPVLLVGQEISPCGAGARY